MENEVVINGEALPVSTLSGQQVAHCLTHVRDWNRQVESSGQGERYEIASDSHVGLNDLAGRWYAVKSSVLDTGRMVPARLW